MSHLREGEVLVVSSGERPGMLLNILQHIGLPPQKNYLVSVEVEKLWNREINVAVPFCSKYI